jgi:hypothetical protein
LGRGITVAVSVRVGVGIAIKVAVRVALAKGVGETIGAAAWQLLNKEIRSKLGRNIMPKKRFGN